MNALAANHPGVFNVPAIDGLSRDKQLVSGHQTKHQVVSYDRKVIVVPTVEGVNKNISGR